MKAYIIWLVGGGCMEGQANENELNDLKEAWINYKCSGGNSIVEYQNIEGSIFIDLKDVQAIAINNQREINGMGYKA